MPRAKAVAAALLLCGPISPPAQCMKDRLSAALRSSVPCSPGSRRPGARLLFRGPPGLAAQPSINMAMIAAARPFRSGEVSPAQPDGSKSRLGTATAASPAWPVCTDSPGLRPRPSLPSLNLARSSLSAQAPPFPTSTAGILRARCSIITTTDS